MQQRVATPLDFAFGQDYQEDVQVTEGLRVRFRLIGPADKAAIAAGFERLSSESRYRRFFAQKKALSPAELQFYANPDGMDHFALGAVVLDAQGREGDGVGIGRFMRLPGEPDVAEIALTVADAYQRRGIGQMLLEGLMAAASERGIRRIRCHLLADNARMHHLIEQVSGDTAFTYDGEMLTGEFLIPPTAGARAVARNADTAPLFNVLRLIAEGSVAPIVLGLNSMRQGMLWMAPLYARTGGPPRTPDNDFGKS